MCVAAFIDFKGLLFGENAVTLWELDGDG